MPGTIDDKRTASNITATLSSYLITAALGVIAAEAVIVTFVLDKREHLAWFYLLSASGVALSVASIYFGGKGIFNLTKRGFDGDWIIKTDRGHFNRQAWSALVGVLVVAGSAFCGNPKPDGRAQEIEGLKNGVVELRTAVSDLESKYQSLSTHLNERASSAETRATQKTKSKK